MEEKSSFENTPVLIAKGLACFRAERRLFSALSFRLAAGELLYVEGPNGVGKSTLLRILAGFLPPDRGKIFWGEGSPAAACHYLGHRDALRAELTLYENLAFFTTLLEGKLAAVPYALKTAGCADLAQTRAAFLSLGQRRRASLARLLAVERPLWLLDEPLTGLDKRGQILLEAMIRTHLSKNGCVVMATHARLEIPGARLEMRTANAVVDGVA